jgi:hypothetical protein
MFLYISFWNSVRFDSQHIAQKVQSNSGGMLNYAKDEVKIDGGDSTFDDHVG